MTYGNLVLRATFAACLIATACANETEEKEPTSMCVESVGEGDAARLLVTANFASGCLTSCDTVTESGCTLEEVDGELVLEAYAVVESKGRRCDAICGSIPSVTCELDPDPGSNITLRTEDMDVDYSFPSPDQVCI